LVVNPERKIPPVNLGADGGIILKFIWHTVEWIDLAQGRCKWQAVVNTIMYIQISNNWQICWLDEKLLSSQKDFLPCSEWMSVNHTQKQVCAAEGVLNNNNDRGKAVE
jgi:hypothetical protein